jgi:hypothetical protein
MTPKRFNNIEDVTNEIEEEGNIKEALSFNIIIKVLESEAQDIAKVLEDLPSLPKLLRQVHKHAYWSGMDFGRQIIASLSEDDDVRLMAAEENKAEDKKLRGNGPI